MIWFLRRQNKHPSVCECTTCYVIHGTKFYNDCHKCGWLVDSEDQVMTQNPYPWKFSGLHFYHTWCHKGVPK